MPAHSMTASPNAFTIDLVPSGQTLPCEPAQTLWQALQRAGVPWPVSCRNGSCRTCIGQLVQGRVRYEIDWPGLLPEEKTEGWVLPCAAYPESDLVLRGPGDTTLRPAGGAP